MRKKAHSWDFNGFYAKRRGERGNGQMSLAASVVDGHTERQQRLKAAVWTPGWIELRIIESSADFIHRSLKPASKGFLTLCMHLYTWVKNSGKELDTSSGAIQCEHMAASLLTGSEPDCCAAVQHFQHRHGSLHSSLFVFRYEWKCKVVWRGSSNSLNNIDKLNTMWLIRFAHSPGG